MVVLWGCSSGGTWSGEISLYCGGKEFLERQKGHIQRRARVSTWLPMDQQRQSGQVSCIYARKRVEDCAAWLFALYWLILQQRRVWLFLEWGVESADWYNKPGRFLRSALEASLNWAWANVPCACLEYNSSLTECHLGPRPLACSRMSTRYNSEDCNSECLPLIFESLVIHDYSAMQRSK